MEKFNFLNKEKKKSNLSSLEDKMTFIKENGIQNFEDWSKKTFKEKMDILVKLDVIPNNFNHFRKNSESELTESFKKNFREDNEESLSELNRNFDFYMRMIKYPNYKEQSERLYPDDNHIHKYPEELLDIDSEVLNFFKKDSSQAGNKDDYSYILSPIDALKKGGIKDLSDWYKKTVDEKRKILMSGEFMGVDIEVKSGKIPLSIMYGKEKYNAYLDQCFLSTVYRASEVLRWKNQLVIELKENRLDKARQNLEKITEEKFLKRVTCAKEILAKNHKEIVSDMENRINNEFPNLSEEDKKEIKDFLLEISDLKDKKVDLLGKESD